MARDGYAGPAQDIPADEDPASGVAVIAECTTGEMRITNGIAGGRGDRNALRFTQKAYPPSTPFRQE